jgi:D-alanyl-D-alanine carboxypeptidase
MIDADNGNVLHEIDATQSWYPASLTKVMTLYMTFEALKSGRIQFFDAMRTSSHAARQPNSKLGLRTGEFLTVRDAVLAIITRSANDASVVLAEHLAGNEENFAAKMTDKAQALGMYNTRFMNATGLPNDWQVTTSRDMAVLAWNIQRHFPEYYQNFSAHSFNYKGTELRGINKFTAKYPGAEGMKTGFTCGSGYNLIAAAHQNGKHLIGVVMGGMTSAERYQLMYQMMDAGFENRYATTPGKHINSLPATLTGSPPYQLGCGSKAYLHTASVSSGGDSVVSRYQQVKSHRYYRARSPHHNKRLVATGNHRQLHQLHPKSRIKKVSHSKVVRRSTTTAHKATVRHTKTTKTRYRHNASH